MSRMLYGPHVADASKLGIRLIGYDRPGYGGSSPHTGRNVSDAAKDVEAIADSFGLEKFAVWGISGGGPHALGCGALLPRRAVAVSSLASPAPYPAPGLDWIAGQGQDNVEEFEAALAGPAKLDEFLGPVRQRLLDAAPEEISEIFDSVLPPVDKAVFTGAVAEFFDASTKIGIRPGYEGWKEDDLAFISDWGFKPSEIQVPVLLWQGKHDKMVPFAHGQWLARHMPRAETRLSPEDGHITLYQSRVPETHRWLLNHF